MLDNDGNAVIIDFDSCLPVGQEIGFRKAGTFGWTVDPAPTISVPENDTYGLTLIAKFVERKDTDLPLSSDVGAAPRHPRGSFINSSARASLIEVFTASCMCSVLSVHFALESRGDVHPKRQLASMCCFPSQTCSANAGWNIAPMPLLSIWNIILLHS
jgi:hypothetical protein